ncbi:MAG: hypothetical protein NTY22_06730 [Proteobacteria bacterium]|nr:hypothetical protein [Pseudomonadota bacterium]
MKKLILILFVLGVFPVNIYAFRSADIGLGPNLNVRGGVATGLMMEGNWNLHKNIGARLLIGAKNGLWVGLALNTTFSLHESATGDFDYSINFSLPYIININNGVKTAFIGVTAGNTLSFAIDDNNKYYIFITPAEFVFVPLTWVLYPNGGFKSGFEVSVMTAIGIRVRL